MGGLALHGRQWQQEPRRDDDNEDKVTLQSLPASEQALRRRGAEDISEANPILLA